MVPGSIEMDMKFKVQNQDEDVKRADSLNFCYSEAIKTFRSMPFRKS